jgi:hypothetical protein
MPLDVQVTRERQRRRRLRRIALVLSPLVAWLWIRLLLGNPVSPGWPDLPAEAVYWLPGIAIILILGIVMVAPMMGSGRSPEVVYLPEQIDVSFDNVLGLGPVLSEVRQSLEVFLNHQHFREHMGGQPRRGILFEGPPGTGKTHTAKAMAKEAGVPFLFVSSTAFQSMWYGATARKIRSYFRRLRKVAREEGGAIGFIEEFDAIGARRGGASSSRGPPAPARPTPPRRWRRGRGCRSSSSPPRPSGACGTGPRPARSGPTSAACGRWRAKRAAPSASSRSSMPSALAAAA